MTDLATGADAPRSGSKFAERAALTTIASHNAAPQRVLAALADDRNIDVRRCVAANRSSPAATVDMLCSDPEVEVRCAAVANPVSVQSASRLAGDPQGADLEMVFAAGTNPALPAVHLRALAAATNSAVRRAVAANPNSDAATLAVLAADDDEMVREQVAGNRSTPVETLAALADTVRPSDIVLLHTLALNENAAPLLRRLVAAEPGLVVAVFMNPACPPDLIEELACAATRQPSAPLSL